MPEHDCETTMGEFAIGVSIAALQNSVQVRDLVDLAERDEDLDLLAEFVVADHMTEHLFEWVGEDPAAQVGALKTVMAILALTVGPMGLVSPELFASIFMGRIRGVIPDAEHAADLLGIPAIP